MKAINQVIVILVLILAQNISGQSKINILEIDAVLEPKFSNKSIKGKVNYFFKVKQKTDHVYLDAVEMNAELIKASSNNINLSVDDDQIKILGDFEPNEVYEIAIQYYAEPREALYFISTLDSYQIWTQGQGKDTSNWLPVNDDINDKMIFKIAYISPKDKKVIANGTLDSISLNKKSNKVWHYDMEQPMSSYLLAFSMGDFVKKNVIDKNLYYFLPQNDSSNFEPTFRYTEDIYDYFISKIGVDFPWMNYKQVAVKDFLYAGMENTSCTLFSDAFVVDSTGFNDRNYVNVNAHEMAHHWFGNSVTAKNSKHHWLHEGFATYYALLAEKEIFGEDYFYFRLYQTAKKLYDRSNKGKGEKVMSKRASSLTYYQAGAWALHYLNQKIGDKKFDKIVKAYLDQNAYGNVATSDFLKQVDQYSDIDTLSYKNKWLNQTAFQGDKALTILEKNETIKQLIKLESLRQVPFKEKQYQLNEVLDQPIDQFLGQEAVYQLPEPHSDEIISLYLKAFSADDLIVRQAISERLNEIPDELLSNYESLLDDDSYKTKEQAFLNLWMNFPDKRKIYLDKYKNLRGFKDYNIRTLWLTLAIATQDYQAENTNEFLNELVDYTSPKRRFQTRQNAFNYLYQLQVTNGQIVKNLIQACKHHNWRFKNYARRLFEKYMKLDKFTSLLDTISLDKADKALIDKLGER